ncbi:MAG: hypothetical protein FJ029_00735 [Actinobacteria bacterium]|nr:hypothetical protein [Actinomycetota bacterium]
MRVKAANAPADLATAAADVQRSLRAAVEEFLVQRGADDAGGLALLNDAILRVPRLAYNFPATIRPLHAVDIDGDGHTEVLAAFGQYGGQAIWFKKVQGEWRANAFAALDSPAMLALKGMPEISASSDLDGDGVADAVVVTTVPGASAITLVVQAYVWRAGAPVKAFEWPVDTWAGPGSWKLRPAGRSGEFVIACTALGTFDHKLLPHPQQTRVYAWDGSRFSLRSVVTGPPVDLHDYVNRAEAAFARGDYALAAERYRQVVAQPAAARGEPVDWPGFAHLRLGMIAALRGDAAYARFELAEAERRGGSVGELATAFATRYGMGDGDVLRAFAALQRTDLAERLELGKAGNLEFPIVADAVLAIGKALEAAIAATAARGLAEIQLTEIFLATELAVGAWTIADLNGDGVLEGVYAVPYQVHATAGPDPQSMWLLTQRDGRWVAELLPGFSPNAFPDQVEGVPGGGRVIVVQEPVDGRLLPRYVSWNGRQAAVWLGFPSVADIQNPHPPAALGVGACPIE